MARRLPLLAVAVLLRLCGPGRARADTAPTCDAGDAVWKDPAFCLALPVGWRASDRHKPRERLAVFALNGDESAARPRVKVTWVPRQGTTFAARAAAAIKGVPAAAVLRDRARAGARVWRIKDSQGERSAAVVAGADHFFTCQATSGAGPEARDLPAAAVAICETLAVPGGGSIAEPGDSPADPSAEPSATAAGDGPSIREGAAHERAYREGTKHVAIVPAWRVCRRKTDCVFLWRPCLASPYLAVARRHQKRVDKLVARACTGMGWAGDPEQVELRCEERQCTVKRPDGGEPGAP